MSTALFILLVCAVFMAGVVAGVLWIMHEVEAIIKDCEE